uniref:Uncharacterized protein n=1 Tax=Electrophorus electricus TaxID=8005 RepID=A0AAY5EEW1_ELEEL
MSEPARSYRGQRERNGGGNRRDHRPRPPPSDRFCTLFVPLCVSGIVLICATLTNMLVLFCIVAAQVTLSGMSAMNFGSSFVDTVIPFEGVELQQVRELDMQFGQMRAPGVYGGVVFSLVFGVISLLLVLSSNKPAYALPTEASDWPVCLPGYRGCGVCDCSGGKRLYARNGYTWMNSEAPTEPPIYVLIGPSIR